MYYTLLCPSSNRPLTPVDRARKIGSWMTAQRKMRSSAQLLIWLVNTCLRSAWMLPQWYAERIVGQSHGGISNIPGPASPLKFNGVAISRMQVVNPIAHAAVGQLGIAVISYCGKFSFSVMMERDDAVPSFRKGSAERIVALFEQELAKLVEAAKEKRHDGKDGQGGIKEEMMAAGKPVETRSSRKKAE